MSNNIRAVWSNPALVQATDDLERILDDRALSFRTVYIHGNSGHTGSLEIEPIHNRDQTFSSLDREGSRLSPTARAQSAPAAVISDIELLPQVFDYFWYLVGGEVAREHMKHQQATQQAVGTAFSDIPAIPK